MAERKTGKAAKTPKTGKAAGGGKKAAPAGRVVNLALQGGGSHGAFTWGVLDRLLEDGRLSFEGISGTSAGAINGALLICGLAKGGPEGARALLEELWSRVGEHAAFAPFQPTWMDRLSGNPNLDNSPAYVAFDMMLRLASPYQFNPLDYNPLRGILTELIDPNTMRASRQPRLYVSATDVLNGRLKVFANDELSIEALLASACLPFLFQAVQIEGSSYWDGGYMGNPTLYPLLHSCAAQDVVVVQINPIHRPDVPMTPTAIIDRMNEIGFNSTFLRETRAMALINRLLEERKLDPETCGLKPIHLHLIGAEAEMSRYTTSSKFNADFSFIMDLHALGRETASAWLDDPYDSLGQRTTFEAGALFI